MAPNELARTTTTVSTTTTTKSETQVFFDDKNKYYPVASSPQSEQENTLETARKVVRDFQLKNKIRKSFAQQNEVIKQEASRMHSEAAVFSPSCTTMLLLIFLTLMHQPWWPASFVRLQLSSFDEKRPEDSFRFSLCVPFFIMLILYPIRNKKEDRS